MHRFALAAMLCTLVLPALAKDAGRDAYMIRVMKCVGPDAIIELYLPKSITRGGDNAIRAMRPAIGWYALDLSQALKGKPLEPVRISLSADKKTLIVNQYTRGLPPTRIPIKGGTVDFDQRFGTQAKCGAFNTQK